MLSLELDARDWPYDQTRPRCPAQTASKLKIIKVLPTPAINDRCITLIVRVGVMPWPLNRRNSLVCTIRTSRQRSYNQRVVCLLCSMARIYDLWDSSLDNGQSQGGWSGPLLWSGWLWSSSTVTPSIIIQIHITYI